MRGQWRTLLESSEHDPHRAELDASVWNGKKGPDPRKTFRSSHLLTTQLPLRLAGTSTREAWLLGVVEETVAVLGGVFHLDPVPHLMRHYVAEQDIVLRRTAENLSAAVNHLKHTDKERFARLRDVVAALPEYEVRSLDSRRGHREDPLTRGRRLLGRAFMPLSQRQWTRLGLMLVVGDPSGQL